MSSLKHNYDIDNDIGGIRDEFSIFSGSDYIYLDSGATSLKPRCVARACNTYLEETTANVGRANHRHAEKATADFEQARSTTASWINAFSDEIIFTHNCTDSINTIAQALKFGSSKRVLISDLEHHSNILPWANRCEYDVIPSDDNGHVCLERLKHELMRGDVQLISVTWVSNVTGNIQPVREIAKLAREYGAELFIDAAQAAGHIPIDAHDIDCDYLAFSSHKMFGPTGVGVLYVKRDRYSSMGLVREGGGMVNSIDQGIIRYRSAPNRYEAGTPNIAGILGHAAAVEFIGRYSASAIHQHNHKLCKYFEDMIQDLDFITFPFPINRNRIPIYTFVPKANTDVNLVSKMLCNHYNIAVGSGYQCNQPLYRKHNLGGGIRVSMHAYNTYEDIDKLHDALRSLAPFLR